jgi:serine/threonine protein kinase
VTQLPTWQGEPLPSNGSLASAGAGRDPGGSHEAAPTREPATREPAQDRNREPGREPGTPSIVHHGQRAAPGAVIGGRYALRTAIGHGGMGTVWRASDTILRRDVAVKEVLLPPGLAPTDRDAMYQRTLREARAAAALSHPAVVQVYDVVTEAGRPWIVMELLQSRSLAEMIVEDGPFAPRAVAKIGIALLGALEVAHAAGVLHRDVKPANVLICGDGRCVLTDFGVARMPTDSELTTPGMVLGSPHFISPERAIGAKFGPPSDLFSLGVTLYTAVEGRPPFDRRDPFETMRAVVEEPPAPAVRAGALAGVLYGLLEKDPARRWTVETARAVLRDLLVGPLASNAPAHVTDPYAVVRQAPYQPPVTPPQPTGQIGGRAMLAPGESISSALRRLQKPGGHKAGGHKPTSHKAADTTVHRPVDRDVAQEHTDATAARFSAPGGQDGLYGTDWMQPAAPTAPKTSLSDHAQRALGVARRAPRWAQLAAAGGLALVLLLGIGAAAGLFGSDPNATSAGGRGKPSAGAAAAPLIDVQEFRDARGITLNVPKTWTKQPAATYMDFLDPADKSRKVRVNVESGVNSRSFLEAAEKRLKTVTSSCVPPYARIDLRDVKLDGKDASELEYTCGSGDQQRHALWGAVVIGGKSYHFFLTVPQGRFTESKIIYQEMVRSFKVVPAASATGP